MKHKHYEVIMAWAEGKRVQVRYCQECAWADVSDYLFAPSFNVGSEYRIKPEPKKLKYRVALFSWEDETFTLTAQTETQAAWFESRADFIRWLTDWTEVELED